MGLRSVVLAIPLFSPLGLAGCGSNASVQQQCTVSYPLTVSPLAATLDHLATGTQNAVQFRGIAYATSPPGCPQRTDLGALVYATWSNPDPADIKISSADDSTNGLATCINATPAAVTLTGTFQNVTLPNGTVVGTPENATYVVNVTLACK